LESSKQDDKVGEVPKQKSLTEKLDNVLTGGNLQHQIKVQMIEAGIENQVDALIKDKLLEQKAIIDLSNSKSGSFDEKLAMGLLKNSEAAEQRDQKSFELGLTKLYQEQRNDFSSYSEFLNKELDNMERGFNIMSVAVSFIPSGGTSSALFLSGTEIRASMFSLKGGYGVFGKSGLKVAGYKIEAMYATPRVGYGTGSIFSIKQIGVRGGNFLRWDYGVLHGTQELGLHSSFRLNALGKTFGGTGQFSWYAPFKFWNYSR
jgi:hypothetical protein